MATNHYTTVLTDGFVLLSERPESDPVDFIAQTARISRANEDVTFTRQQNLSLIEFMLENKHTSPFEMVSYSFDMRLPLSIATQILRHRTGSFNVMSHRYTEANKAMDDPKDQSWFTPIVCPEDIRITDPLWKQGSLPLSFNGEAEEKMAIKTATIMSIVNQLERNTKENHELYNDLVKQGVAKEQARFYLPCGEYTVMRMRMNLHNLMHFIKLRTASDAQLEVQVYAEAVRSILLKEIPDIMLLYDKYNRESLTFNLDEITLLKRLDAGAPLDEVLLSIKSDRKRQVFARKYAQIKSEDDLSEGRV